MRRLSFALTSSIFMLSAIGAASPALAGKIFRGDINANGTLAQGSGVVSVSKISTGQYQVNFPQNITKCTSIATRGTAGNSGGGSVGAGMIGVDPRSTNPNALWVETYNAAGAAADTSFKVLVRCGSYSSF